MATHIKIGNAQTSRMRAMVIPREHGAWGMLLVPLATGAVVALRGGGNASALTLFLVAALSLFWLRTPVESWLGTSAIKAQTEPERKMVLRTILAIAALALASVTALLWNGNRGLMLIGAIAGSAFAVQAVVRKLGRKGRMPAQLIGAIGLSSSAAGAYYVATGHLDGTAIALWLANWLFAADQIHFVQLRIHSSKAGSFEEKLHLGLPFLLMQIALIATVFAACRFGLFPAVAAAAFLPVLLRGTLWFLRRRQPLDVHKLGFSELGQSLLFGALLCAAFLI
jgi:YwiC-like protein